MAKASSGKPDPRASRSPADRPRPARWLGGSRIRGALAAMLWRFCFLIFHHDHRLHRRFRLPNRVKTLESLAMPKVLKDLGRV